MMWARKMAVAYALKEGLVLLANHFTIDSYVQSDCMQVVETMQDGVVAQQLELWESKARIMYGKACAIPGGDNVI